MTNSVCIYFNIFLPSFIHFIDVIDVQDSVKHYGRPWRCIADWRGRNWYVNWMEKHWNIVQIPLPSPYPTPSKSLSLHSRWAQNGFKWLRVGVAIKEVQMAILPTTLTIYIYIYSLCTFQCWWNDASGTFRKSCGNVNWYNPFKKQFESTSEEP